MAYSLTLCVVLLSALATVHCDTVATDQSGTVATAQNGTMETASDGTEATAYSGTVKVWGLRGSGLSGDAFDAPNVYVKVWCGAVSGGQTHIIDNNDNPSWNNQFTFTNVNSGTVLKLEVWDKDVWHNDHLGTCSQTISQGSSNSVQCIVKKGRLNYYYSYM